MSSGVSGEESAAAGMAGRVCVVTGATSGIGYETALGLARQGATVIGVGRSRERCEAARSAIHAATRSDAVSFEVADLGSQREIRALADRIEASSPRVDVLINNAGTFTARRRVSAEGIELQFAVNYLAAFLLTHELMPLLRRSADARVINLSSGSHFGARLQSMDRGPGRRYSGLRAYAHSKLACILFTEELARRVGRESSVSTYAVDPGLVNTDMGLKDASLLVRLVWLIRRRRGITPGEGARTSVFLAGDPAAPQSTGRYWKLSAPIASSPESHDAEGARRLWELSERLCGIEPGSFGSPGPPRDQG